MQVRVAVLGPLAVEVEGEPVDLGARKQRAVLAVLALRAGDSVSTDLLVHEIWGESAPRAARSVQVYVSALRSALGAAGQLLETVGAGYRLAVAAEQVDARCFEAGAAEAAARSTAGGHDEAAKAAAAALALWRGPVLADLPDLPMAQDERVRLEAVRLDTVEVRIDADLALGRAAAVLTELPELVVRHPLRERLRGQLMLALHRTGRQADALATYREGRDLLVDELGVEPGQALRDLHQALLRDDPALQVEPAELRGRRHLPAPATPLVGRRREIDMLTGLLRTPGVRLVTATGPGGIGKTRLGVQAASELADAFPGGVFFVGLAELRDPALLLPTVAAALDVTEVPDEPALRTLRRRLSDQPVLLLLDNFEQVDAAATVVAELLSAAAGLKVLVTSRSPLRLYGEHEHPVPQLELGAEAVPLFEARALAADATADLSGPTAAEAVADICGRLDCLPLAIELAAARVRVVPVAQMLATLPQRLELAVGGPRDLAARQQTLRNAIGWSHDLLSPEERRVFAALAVFVGGCTEEAANRVVGGTAQLLGSLVSSSLLRRRDGADATRYLMLETIREYAAERLAGATAVRDAHAAYFLDLAERASEGLRGPDQRAWAARLDAERDNFRAALDHLLDGPDSERALRLAAALGFHWYRTGTVGEGASWLDRALAAAPGAADQVRAQALHVLGILVAEQGDDTRALGLCETSGELFRAAGDRAGLARSLNSQGGIARDLGDLARAELRYAESVELRRAIHDPPASFAIVLGNLAMVALDRGNLTLAREIGEQCLHALDGSAPWLEATSLLLLADVAVAGGEAAHGADLLGRALPLLRDGGPYRLVEYLDSCAGLAAGLGRAEDAARLTGAADAELDRLGGRMVAADVALRERRVAAARRSLGDARFEQLRAEGSGWTLAQAVDRAGADVVAAGSRSGRST